MCGVAPHSPNFSRNFRSDPLFAAAPSYFLGSLPYPYPQRQPEASMFDFLQGLAFGLLVSFMPWFMAGLYDPRLVVPEELASRWQVILRYAVAMPSVAMLLLMTSFWGGFGASLGGWLVGLAAVPVELFMEKRWRRWREARAGRDRAAARERQRTTWPVPAASATC